MCWNLELKKLCGNCVFQNSENCLLIRVYFTMCTLSFDIPIKKKKTPLDRADRPWLTIVQTMNPRLVMKGSKL